MIEATDLEAVVEAEDLAFAAAIDSAGLRLAESGDQADCPAPELVSALLGPYGDSRETFGSVEGQILPRIWSQGAGMAYVDRPEPEVVVVFFDKASCPSFEDPVEKVKWKWQRSREVASALRERMGAPPLD